MLPTAEGVSRRAAEIIAEEARASVAERGRFLLATSGGDTPRRMLRLLAAEEKMPWPLVHLFQVDERVVSSVDPDRNLAHLRACLAEAVAFPPEHLHAMPVESDDLELAAGRYAETLRNIAGDPPVLDLAHLGLGVDGHTASLVPGDPALEIANADVTVTDAYQGHRRMTLTFPTLNRARAILWVVTGEDKAEALEGLRRGDPSMPAGRVRRDRARILADVLAAGPSRRS